MKSARQTQITSDLLQAPGNKKLIQTAAVKQDDQTQQFPIWLHTISTRFMGLRDRQRIQVLDTLLGLCGAAELTHLSALLPTLLYRDFLRLLPVETSEHIVLYLDPKSLLNCCLVSFYWNELINSFRQVWMKLASRAGARVNVDPCCTVPMYKHLFLQTTHLVHSMKNKTAFETITLEGHQRPVVAIAHDGDNIVATAAWQAIRETFQRALVRGCVFHWTQRIYRMVMRLGLSVSYCERGGGGQVYLPAKGVGAPFSWKEMFMILSFQMLSLLADKHCYFF